MDPSLLRKSIEDWDRLYRATRLSLIPRTTPPMPTGSLGAALIGVRRCGKTYTAIEMSQAMPDRDVLYYNFEDPVFILDDAVRNLDLLLEIAAEVKGKSPRLLLLDEIQNVAGWERWLRKMLDLREHEVIVTGSSAKLLSRELATAIAGRCIESRIWPLSFREYLQFTQRSSDVRADHLAWLRSYLQWGGFPEVALTPVDADKHRILQQYLSDIVLKDVLQRSGLRSQRALMQVLTYYLTNPSSLHSYSAVKNAFGLGIETVELITQSLVDAFLVFEVNRYHPNLKIQARDARKLYVIDTGLRNAGSRSAQDDLGKLLENAIYLELLRRGAEIRYFKGEREVDFIITEHSKPAAAIQVCASDMEDQDTIERELSALHECLDTLSLGEGTIISWNREQTLKQSGHVIHIVPAYKWLTRN